MDLKKTWDKMQMDQFSMGIMDDKDILEAMHKKSHGPVQKIQTGFTIKQKSLW